MVILLNEIYLKKSRENVREWLKIREIRERFLSRLIPNIRYWILSGRQTVKNILRSCTVCNRFQGLPYGSLSPPDLPHIRVSDGPPFVNTGIDFAGPLYTHERQSDGLTKAYVCLFTCASTRAVHLELAPDLSVGTFLRMFRRFVSRRGLPSTLITDNAKTFKAASNQIVKISRATEVIHYLHGTGALTLFLCCSLWY